MSAVAADVAPFPAFVRHGWALCPIEPGSKGPRSAGWQRRENAIRSESAAARLPGAGLLHAWSGTCAIDVDDLHGAVAWLGARGVDLAALLEDDASVQIRSGRPNRAKLLYRVPAGCTTLPTRKIVQDGGAVLFELRCASADGESVQDVLPPTIHPDTGRPYEWAGAGDWQALPELPPAVLALWRKLVAEPTAAGKAPAPGEAIGAGQRNDVMFKIACKLRAGSFSESTILAALQAENRARCTPPLTDEELRTIARSAARYAPAASDEPRRETLTAIRASAFVRDFVPPDPILEVIPATSRGRVIGLTGPTGHGKTTVAALLQVHIGTGMPIGGKDVTRGRVLVLCGENPDDFCLHLIATMQDLGLEPADLDDILVVPSRFDIDAEFPNLCTLVEGFGDLAAVFVDTSAAFNFSDDDNANRQQYEHASDLRRLTTLPGRPAVFVLCHPIKNPTKDNLVPRGGGAFLNEIDANLTVWKDEASNIVSMHWAGKMRGPNFDPIRFELRGVELEGYKDAKGRPVASAVARLLADDRVEQIQERALDDEDKLLVALHRRQGSVRELAAACGWTNGEGKPNASRVDRRLKKLLGQGLAQQDRRGRWGLTPKGQKEAEALR